MTSPADVRYSTPGYAYRVAVHSTRQEEGTPPCSCPCHVAKTPRGARGWYCNQCHAFIACCSWPQEAEVPYTHQQAIEDGSNDPCPYMVSVPDFWFITKGNTLEDNLGEHFDTAEAAEARADELNQAAVVASLDFDPAFAGRRERLKLLGETFWVRYGEGHPETRWPEKPGRYAVEAYSERYSGSFWETHETLDEVRAAIVQDEIGRVVDLDTGLDVPFSVTVEFA